MATFMPTADGRGLVADTFRAMGSDTEVMVVGGTDHHLALARQLVVDLERRWSRFLPTSDISRINAAGGADVVVDRATIALVTAMVQGWSATGGAFDPTLLVPLVESGYAASRHDDTMVTELPSGAARRSVVDAILVDPAANVVRAPAGMVLDPGGIGKGLAADLVVAALLGAGAAGALIGIGGDVRVGGVPPQDGGWRITVTDASTGAAQDRLVLAEGGVATSGIEHRAWRSPSGRDVHHLLDPLSGEPVAATRNPLVEVTVVAGSAAWAEVFTKAVFMKGPRAAFTDLDGRGLGVRARWADGWIRTNRAWTALADTGSGAESRQEMS